MKIIKRFLILLVMLFCLTIFCSCTDSSENLNHPMLKKAELLQETGDYAEAIKYYKKYLQIKPDTANIHLKIALIYDENLNDLVQAIYHYKEYINLAPNASDKELVTEWVELCENRFLEQKTPKVEAKVEVELPKVEEKVIEPTPVVKEVKVTEKTPTEKVVVVSTQPKVEEPKKIKKKIETVVTVNSEKQETEVQKTVDAKYPKFEKIEKVKVEPKKNLSDVEIPQNNAKIDKVTFPRYYIVRKGDTLSEISMKFYGSMKYYKNIMHENNLRRPSDLRAGARILLPKVK